MPELKIPQPPLREFRVTVYPKPMTFKVMAQTEIQAQLIAQDNYGSGDVTKYGFYRNDVTDLSIFNEEETNI